MGKHTLASDLTDEERAFGFDRVKYDGGHAITLALPHELVAVKMNNAKGEVEYVLCTEGLEPIIVGGKTLEELEARFIDEGAPPRK
jgi:hypothetical protein